MRTWKRLICALIAAASAWSARGATTTVSYGFFFFSPKIVRISPGDTVSWTGGAGHTLLGLGSDPVCGGASLPCSHTFPATGSFAYECTVPGHAASGMTGLVIVASSPPIPALLTNGFKTNGMFRFTISGTANKTNIIQATSGLNPPSNWVGISTQVPSASSWTFTDTNSGLQLRFYRVLTRP